MSSGELLWEWGGGDTGWVILATEPSLATFDAAGCRYGELGNADLVSKYGFALRQNPFTAVGLGKAELLEAAARVLGNRQFRQRCRTLREQTDVLDDEEEPFEVRLSSAAYSSCARCAL